MNDLKTNPSPFSHDRECMSARLSFREAFRRAAIQTELSLCNNSRADQMRELCYIIAEVYIINSDSKIAISDETLDAYLVQEIFSELRYQHLELVLENFNSKTEIVKNKRAYLRTALYNSIFEYESHYINLVKHDMEGFNKK